MGNLQMSGNSLSNNPSPPPALTSQTTPSPQLSSAGSPSDSNSNGNGICDIRCGGVTGIVISLVVLTQCAQAHEHCLTSLERRIAEDRLDELATSLIAVTFYEENLNKETPGHVDGSNPSKTVGAGAALHPFLRPQRR
ncbi:uncharacterized protein [Lolium perenne]|uniref:uncharacterized protein n=1 Tax=Lolium perenne TaxID=4522 RepID=UPI0021F5EEDD|nr:uncharacterized protein LOC127348761 [Lolium perenne]